MYGMNIIQLNVFKEVMASGSISQAARKLGRTQPAISLSIKNLEESIGLKLFARQGRRLVPVPEAYYLLAEAEGILDRLATVSATMKSLLDAEAGNLNLATMPGPAAVMFPRFVSSAVGDNPDIKISLSSRSSQQVHELAGTQSIDFGFADLYLTAGKSPQYSTETISADCFCALSVDHALARKDSISFRDLDGLPMGGLKGNHTINQRTADAFEREGSRFNQTIDSQIFMPLLQFIKAGQCSAIVDPLTVVSEQMSGITDGGVVFKPLTIGIRYDYSILTPQHRPPSRLAIRVKQGWVSEVMQALDDIGANPEFAG